MRRLGTSRTRILASSFALLLAKLTSCVVLYQAHHFFRSLLRPIPFTFSQKARLCPAQLWPLYVRNSRSLFQFIPTTLAVNSTSRIVR